MTPTNRTKHYLRDHGGIGDTVERYNHHIRQHFDCFGFGDVLGVFRNKITLIQACTGTDRGRRIKKILALEGDDAHSILIWMQAGGSVEVWAWRQLRSLARTKKGDRSTRKEWVCNRSVISLTYASKTQMRDFTTVNPTIEVVVVEDLR